MNILTSRLFLGAIALSVLIFGAMYFGAKWVYRDMPGDNVQVHIDAAPPIDSIKLTHTNASDEYNAPSDTNAANSTSTSDTLDWESNVDDEMIAMLAASVEDSDPFADDVTDDGASPAVDVPAAFFNPPPPPSGGIADVWQGITEDNAEELTVAYVKTYYPLVAFEGDRSLFDERTKVEFKRQKDALDKEVWDTIRTSFAVLSPEMMDQLPLNLKDDLRKVGFIE